MMDFNFLFDSRFAKIVNRDYLELQELSSAKSPKSVLVLSGSIIEGILSDALIATGDFTFEKVDKMDFDSIIKAANNAAIIKKTDLSHILRNYRNLVHPSCEIMDQVEFDEADAQLARSAVEVLIREVKKWSQYWRVQLEFASFLKRASKEELFFLSLFSQDKTDNDYAFEHPWLRKEVFLSLDNLVKNGILVREPALLAAGNWTETVSLVADAVKQIEAIVLKTPAKRKSINLVYRMIESDAATGGGATGSCR
ncbi:hypothetical protein BH10ACI2_BH10ACI2_17960 [soil metagenome]